MPGEILRNATIAVIFGCTALFLIRKGPLREILRVVLGILLILAVMLPIAGGKLSMKTVDAFHSGSWESLKEEQEMVYQQALTEKTEELIENYFADQSMQVDASVELRDGAVSRVILCPAQAYEWTQEKAAAFSSWSGISAEKQEWIWN